MALGTRLGLSTFPPHHQHWLLLLRKAQWTPVCVMTLMFDYSMHTHTRSKGAKAQELERLQNTTRGPIHLQNIQNPYKRGCIGPFNFFVGQLSLYGHSLG